MTKSTSGRVAFFKKIALIPLFAATAFVFSASTNVIAQDATKIIKQQKDTIPKAVVGLSVGSTKEGVSPELLNEYQNIIKKYKTDTNSWLEFREKVAAPDRNRLETIYKQMSKEQQESQTVAFIKEPKPLPKTIPAKAQMESFKNPGIYGVWINGKKVSNTTLNKYINTDFSQVFISKLYGGAKKNVSYLYQVDLMTKDYYQKYYDEEIANKDNSIMVFQRFTKEKDIQ